MRRGSRIPDRLNARSGATFCALLGTGLIGACTGPQSMLEPRGPGAAAIATLWWVLLAIMTAVFLVVMVALAYALFHRRGQPDDDSEPAERRRVVAVLVAGAAVPAVILAGIFGYTLSVLDDVGPSVTDPEELTVTVIGKQFWWDIRYPTADGDTVVTANELHVPVGRRVTLLLESDNVIHSVWIPQLHGKTDMIPGRTNRMWLRVDEPGLYWGQCAEYCGEQHAWMKMLVVAEPESEFRAWLARERRPALPAPPPRSPAAGGDTVSALPDSLPPDTVAPEAILPGPASAAAAGPGDAADVGAVAESSAAVVPQEPGDHAGPPVPDSVRRAALVRNDRIRRGREVFLDPDHRCAACHTIRGVSEAPPGGPGERPTDGPDLTHVASRRTIAGGMLRTTRGHMGGWIANPQVLKPGNLMPRIPLEPEEMNALLEYLMSLR